jgi:hypothetical protein
MRKDARRDRWRLCNCSSGRVGRDFGSPAVELFVIQIGALLRMVGYFESGPVEALLPSLKSETFRARFS